MKPIEPFASGPLPAGRNPARPTRPLRRALPAILGCGALWAGLAAPLAAQEAGDVAAQDIVGRSAAELFQRRCRDLPASPEAFVLFGVVKDPATGTPLPIGTVRVWWQTVGAEGDTLVQYLETQTDTQGEYLFCRVPRGVQLIAQADALGKSGALVSLSIADRSLFRRQDLPVYITRADGAVFGRVVDLQTGDPIDAATVTLAEFERGTLTDARGRFRLEEVPYGEFRVDIHHLAYGDQWVSVEVRPGNTEEVEIQLAPAPIELEPIVVAVASRPRWLENEGFYQRRDIGLGQFLTPEQVEARRSIRFSELLRGLPGLTLRKICQPHCYYYVNTTTNPRLTNCPPLFFVDGRRLRMAVPADLDAIAPVSDIAAIELYRGISQTPAQFYGECGSVVIWTKRGSSG